MFRLAHLSDPHLAPLPKPQPLELLSKRGLGYLNWLRKRHRIHRADVLTTIVADLKTQAVDHIAVTGDLVNLSLSNEFAPARAWLGRLGEPDDVTVVPGNHDAYVRAAAGRAQHHWDACMRGDAGESFPFVRRRGPVALIGLSTSLPTLPLAATGRLHGDQLARLGGILDELARERLFRVVLIHHPPVPNRRHYMKRLIDGPMFRALIAEHGAELILHGHNHEQQLMWLDGPRGRIAAVGVPSASAIISTHDEPAAYNLYRVDGGPGAWQCEMIVRGLREGRDGITELMRQTLR
jgi:3',5'-cyclic AMP phosphodiesterase CpdA